MKTLFTSLLTITLLIITTEVVRAQPELPNAPSQAPIDGGLSLLAVAGGAYAIKKLRKSNKAVEVE